MRLGFLLLALLALPGGVALAVEGEGGATGAVSGTAAVSTTENIPSLSAQRSFTPAELDILQSLEDKRIELDRRAQALELRERLVDMLEQRLADRIGELNTLKADLEKVMKSASGQDEDKLRQLASVYAAMKPDAAAGVLNRLDNSLVHDIFVRMPAKKAAKVMEALDPAKARKISEMMGQKLPVPEVSGTAVSGTAAP